MTDAVQEFGISRSTLYRLAKAGRLRIYSRTGDRRSYVSRQEIASLSEFRPKSFKRT